MKEINYDNYYWQDELLRLRAMKEEDWQEHYYNLFDSPARRLLQYQLELPPTIKGAKEFADKFADFNQETGRLMFTVESLDGEVVGALNLCGVDKKNGTFGIGIQIGRDYRGQGYGTSAMGILLNYAFNERRLNKFNVSVLEGNTASATMMKKLGCVQEGVIREKIFTNGKYMDEILFGLTREEFNNKN